jgi:glycosyltransferase involved in cell wall biosynthesis
MDSKRILGAMSRKKMLYIANGNSIHDIKWMTFFSAQTENYHCFLLVDSLNPLSQETIDQLTKLHITVLEPINPISLSHPIRTLRAILYFKRLIRSLRPDLVHVLFATPHALWLNFSKTPSIITMRGSDILLIIPELLTEKGLKKLYFSFLFRQFKKAFLKASFVTGTSLPQIEKAQELFKSANLKLVRTGVDVEKISQLDQIELIPTSLRDKEFVFSPRFMSPIYNIKFQLDAISQLEHKFIDGFTFVFIRGKQFDEKYYQVQLKRLQQLKAEIKLNYLVIDYLDQPSMWMMLKKAALCIMTPISDGTPNSALEAMAAKCPLIISNLNYDKDLFENSCLKLNSFEVIELKDMIENSLANYNPELLSNAFTKVSALGNRHLEMKKLEQLYQSIGH